jgi:hypothetical protein
MIIQCLNCGQRNRVPDPVRQAGNYKCAKPGCQTLLWLPGNPLQPEALKPYDHATYQFRAPVDPSVARHPVFEPALIPQRHLFGAYRIGDPDFGQSEPRQVWLENRRQVMEHLLCLIQQSPWHDHLVLRGSLLLKAWLHKQAREPGDIDWVFQPQDIAIDSPTAQQLFQDLLQMVVDSPPVNPAQRLTIEIEKIAIADIWTYERASGRRIIFPWQATNSLPGEVQMDIVFGEELLSEPIQVSLPVASGPPHTLWAASQELSLAWKLLWLETDQYPQGKDLYDATLLAELTPLPFELLQRVLHSSPNWCDWAARESKFSWKSKFQNIDCADNIDWDNFILEYPWVEGSAKDWQLRLSQALIPTFLDLDDQADRQWNDSASS